MYIFVDLRAKIVENDFVKQNYFIFISRSKQAHVAYRMCFVTNNLIRTAFYNRINYSVSPFRIVCLIVLKCRGVQKHETTSENASGFLLYLDTICRMVQSRPPKGSFGDLLGTP